MQAFRRVSGKLVCDFDDTERHVLCGLVISLIEVLLDAVPGCTGPGTDRIADAEDLFAQLERELITSDAFCGDPNPDPLLGRLFPDPYPDDPAASADFQRYTKVAQRDQKVNDARIMLADLHAITDGRCVVEMDNADAWLKTLSAVRLALSIRLEVRTAEDIDALAELDANDPMSAVAAIFDWLGFVVESLVVTLE